MDVCTYLIFIICQSQNTALHRIATHRRREREREREREESTVLDNYTLSKTSIPVEIVNGPVWRVQCGRITQ